MDLLPWMMTYLALRCCSTCGSGETKRCFPPLQGDIVLCESKRKGVSGRADDAWLWYFSHTHLIESGELCYSLAFSDFVALGLFLSSCMT